MSKRGAVGKQPGDGKHVAAIVSRRAAKAAPAWRLYTVHLIHMTFDWSATFTFTAPNAKKARLFAMAKLHRPENWLATSARLVKRNGLTFEEKK